MDPPRILNVQIADKLSLYKCFMPFIKGGGLFLPVADSYAIGDELLIVLDLCAEPEQYAVIGTVVWITPAAAQNQRPRGIGLQFTENAQRLRMRIENLLSGGFDETAATLTV